MFTGADELMKKIRELEALGKASVAARYAEMSQPPVEPETVDLGNAGDFDVFMRGLGA